MSNAVLFANGIGNFVMATPFFQNIEPVIFIPEDDPRREAIESISCWEVRTFRDVSQFKEFDKVYRLWCAPKVETDNMVIQPKPPLHDWNPNIHESDIYYQLIEKSFRHYPKIKTGKAWKFYKTANQRVIGLGNGSNPSWDKKKWHEARWVELIETLLKTDNDIQFAFFGGKDEAKQGRILEKRFTNKLWNFAGRLNLADSVATLTQCDVFITTDSGLMHCAGALNVPIIALFGSTYWDKNYPISKAKVVKVENKACPHQPCYGKKQMWHCQNAKCMDSITAKQVKEAYEQGFIK